MEAIDRQGNAYHFGRSRPLYKEVEFACIYFRVPSLISYMLYPSATGAIFDDHMFVATSGNDDHDLFLSDALPSRQCGFDLLAFSPMSLELQLHRSSIQLVVFVLDNELQMLLIAS